MSLFAQIPKPPRNPPAEPVPGPNGGGKREPESPRPMPPPDMPPRPPFDLPPEPPPPN
jgi:hypothetical protein